MKLLKKLKHLKSLSVHLYQIINDTLSDNSEILLVIDNGTSLRGHDKNLPSFTLSSAKFNRPIPFFLSSLIEVRWWGGFWEIRCRVNINCRLGSTAIKIAVLAVAKSRKNIRFKFGENWKWNVKLHGRSCWGVESNNAKLSRRRLALMWEVLNRCNWMEKINQDIVVTCSLFRRTFPDQLPYNLNAIKCHCDCQNNRQWNKFASR